MDECWRYQRVILMVTAAVALVAAVVLYAVYPESWNRALGLLWGVVGGLIGFRLKVVAVYRYLQNPENAKMPSGFSWFLIIGLTLAVAVAANTLTGRAIFSTYLVAAGIFLPNLVLIADGFLRRPGPADAKKEDAGEA